MDIDRIYQLMGSALKRVYGFYVKRPLQRFNVDNRAERVIQKETSIPKVAPRHERTDQLFKQITQNNPRIRHELNEKREDLLKRLTSVKVVSHDQQLSAEEVNEMQEIRQRVRNRLPKSHEGTDYPMHAFVEPEFVPKGRISLIRALDFIGKHSKSPEEYDPKWIAEKHDLNEEDVKNTLIYFKPFLIRDDTQEEAVSKTALGLSSDYFNQISSFLKPKPIDKQIDSTSPTSADESIETTTKSQINEKSFKK